MNYYRYGPFCLCPWGGTIPEEAEPAPGPFAPLVFAVRRDPLSHGGWTRIDRLAQLDAPEDVTRLRQETDAEDFSPLAAFVRQNGATVLNTAFTRAYPQLCAFFRAKKTGFRINLVGLGDVGGTVLTGLVLLGREITEIGVYDPNEAQCRRYALEMNQILPVEDGAPMPRVVVRQPDALFDCDALLFTASLGVPPVGSQVADVRMAQYGRNRQMLRVYAQAARARNFTGLFAQISDPVDHLCRAVFLDANRDASGHFDASGLLPEQIQGYGLGVMRARAAYYARQLHIPFERVFGPHGRDLIAANAVGEAYDEALSQQLTQATVRANLAVRELGFKPYLAPGLSSAAISVLHTLRGQWHEGAISLGGAYFGCRSRMTPQGVAWEQLPLHPKLEQRLAQVHRTLREFAYDE